MQKLKCSTGMRTKPKIKYKKYKVDHDQHAQLSITPHALCLSLTIKLDFRTSDLLSSLIIHELLFSLFLRKLH